MSTNEKNRFGVTLIELLTSMAVVAALVAIFLPAVQACRESARRAACQNNLRQIYFASEHYRQNTGRYPSHYDTEFREGWSIALLPFLEKEALKSKVNAYADPVSESLIDVIRDTRPSEYACPSFEIQDRELGSSLLAPVTHYSLNIEAAATSHTLQETSRTFLWQELPVQYDLLSSWHLSPSSFDVFVSSIGDGIHSGGSNVLFADGHVSLLTIGELQ